MNTFVFAVGLLVIGAPNGPYPYRCCNCGSGYCPSVWTPHPAYNPSASWQSPNRGYWTGYRSNCYPASCEPYVVINEDEDESSLELTPVQVEDRCQCSCTRYRTGCSTCQTPAPVSAAAPGRPVAAEPIQMPLSKMKVGKGINAQVLADAIDPILRKFAGPLNPYIIGNSVQCDTDIVTDQSNPNNRYWHRVLAEITRDGREVTIKVITVPTNGSVDPATPTVIRDAIEKSLRKL